MLSSLSMASSPSPASGRPGGGPGGPGPPPETLEAFEFSPCVLQAPADGKMPAMAVPGAGHGKLGMVCSLYMDPKDPKTSKWAWDMIVFYHHMINPLYVIITQYQVLILFLSPYFIINQCKTHHSNPFYPQFPMTSLMTSRIPRSYRSHLQRRPGRGHVQWRAATARRPGFQLLDARIRETRLPRLNGGKVGSQQKWAEMGRKWLMFLLMLVCYSAP